MGMRIVRNAVVIITILSFALFGVTEVIRLVNRDTTLPVITSDREVLEIPCDYTEEQLLEGLTASDEEDGDLTSQIIAGSFSRFIEKGVSNMTYVVFDSADQPATLTREVRFTNYHSPRFTLTEPLVFAEEEGSYTEAMARLGAQDMLDGNLKDWITQTETDVNYQRTGSYTMTVEVSNSFGDTSSAGLPVHVVSAESRTMDIELSASILYVSAGSSVDPDSYIQRVTDARGDEVDPGRVSVSSNVDTQNPGVYEIHYEVSDGSSAGETWLTVIVEE